MSHFLRTEYPPTKAHTPPSQQKKHQKHEDLHRIDVSRIGGHNDCGAVPQRSRPGSAQSGAVRSARDPRACARRQGVRFECCCRTKPTYVHYIHCPLVYLSVPTFRYFFSWRDPALQGVEEDWLGARNFCRQRCMDSVSLETSNENEWIKQRLVDGKVSLIYFCHLAHWHL